MRGENTSLRILTFLLNAFWRALWGLNVFLFATMSLLIAVLCMLVFVRQVAIPDYFSNFIKAEAAKNGIVLNFNSAVFDLDGALEITKATLRFEGTPEPFFAASSVRVSFWILPLFNGKFEFRSARVIDGAIGATYAGAENAPAISNMYLSLRKDGAWWNLDALNLHYGRLALELSGVASQTFSPSDFIADFMRASGRIDQAEKVAEKSDENPSEKPAEKLAESPSAAAKSPPLDSKHFSVKLDEALAMASEYKKYSDMFADPVLILNFSLYGGFENSIRARLRAGSAQFAIKSREAKLENLELVAEYTGNAEETMIATTIFADKFFADTFPSCDNFSARANLLISEGSYSLENIDLSAKKISYEGMSIDNVSLRKKYLDENDYGMDWSLFAALDIYRLGGKFSFGKDFSAVAEFNGNLNPDWILKRKELAKIETLKGFSFANGINIDGSLSYAAVDKNLRLNASVDAQDCVVVNIPVENVSGRVSFDTASNMFVGENVRIKTAEGWGLDGFYSQNMKTHQYSIKLLGDMRPMAIASFMAPWWTRVMGSFKFIGKRNFPKADVSVEGTWGAPEYIWCFARTSGSNAEYSGVDFDKFSMSVWVSPLRITLYDLSIMSQERRATGVIEWLYGDKGITNYNTQEIYLISTLNSRELIALGGSDAREVLDIVRFSSAPEMTVNAVMRNPHHNDGKRDIFNVTSFAAGDTQVECATLKNLSFSARSDKLLTIIDKASCEFCAGQATGNVVLTKQPDKTMDFRGEVFAEKMNQAQFFDFLSSLGAQKKSASVADSAAGASADSAALQASAASATTSVDAAKTTVPAKKNSFAEGGETGEVTMTISLAGNVDNFAMCRGSGYVDVENKELIKLNLFGGLSRATSALHLPFGSFDITYAHSSFEIKDGEVKFPHLEMGGPVMQIRGAAGYNFIDDDIDATLAIIPFGGLTMPILSSVISVINPITSAVQATIDGKISDPEIGISVNPINILQSEKRILENIRSEF